MRLRSALGWLFRTAARRGSTAGETVLGRPPNRTSRDRTLLPETATSAGVTGGVAPASGAATGMSGDAMGSLIADTSLVSADQQPPPESTARESGRENDVQLATGEQRATAQRGDLQQEGQSSDHRTGLFKAVSYTHLRAHETR